MVAALSDQAWADICAVAERTPDAETRERLSIILFKQYPTFAYDRERVKAALRLSELMLQHLGWFAELYRQVWLPHLPEDEVDAIFAGRASAFVVDDKAIEQDCYSKRQRQAIERDCWAIAMLRQRAEAAWLTARAVRRANARRASVQHEWLYNQLCTVWLWDFDALLTYSVPSRGGPPYGPLIAFILAAAGLVMPEPPSPETVRDAIDRERMERENARQLSLFLADRRPLEPDVPD
jgi:hypothetical protein